MFYTGPVMPPVPEQLIRIRARSDALPEHAQYRDDGCDIHPHCLSCPLPRCRYDEPGGLRALLNAYRDRQILELRRRGVRVDAIASRFGLSRRTIFRIFGKNGNGASEDSELRQWEANEADGH